MKRLQENDVKVFKISSFGNSDKKNLINSQTFRPWGKKFENVLKLQIRGSFRKNGIL